MLSGDVLWCRVCGAFSATRAGGLAKACTGRPGGSGRLARLLRGTHPVTGADIGVPLAEDGDLTGLERAIVRPVRILRIVAQAAETYPSFAAVRARVRPREAASLHGSLRVCCRSPQESRPRWQDSSRDCWCAQAFCALCSARCVGAPPFASALRVAARSPFSGCGQKDYMAPRCHS